MGIYDKNIKNGNGISYSKEVDSSADWSGVTNSTYFKDLSDSLIYYKSSGGTIISIFEEVSTMSPYSFKANITSGVATPTDATEGDLTSALPDSLDGIVGFNTATGQIVRFPASKLLNVQFSGVITAGAAGISVDSMQLWYASALAQSIIFGVPLGTPTESQQLRIRLKDNGTARGITWNSIFEPTANIPLPTTTVVGETLFLTFVFNAVVSKWQLIQSTQSGGSSTPTLNNGQIYVGDASNAAQSVAMSGDTTISNTGVVTIGSDKVTYDKMQDTTQAALLGNQSGAGTVSEIPIVEAYIPAGTTRTLLETTTNWDVNGNYTGASITGTYQGQAHYNGNYWFTAVADNTWIRLIRG